MTNLVQSEVLFKYYITFELHLFISSSPSLYIFLTTIFKKMGGGGYIKYFHKSYEHTYRLGHGEILDFF
jgi:hypothetical protein